MVDKLDLMKIQDVLLEALNFHRRRDEMNGHLHLARQVRYSPLTSALECEYERVSNIILELTAPAQNDLNLKKE